MENWDWKGYKAWINHIPNNGRAGGSQILHTSYWVDFMVGTVVERCPSSKLIPSPGNLDCIQGDNHTRYHRSPKKFLTFFFQPLSYSVAWPPNHSFVVVPRLRRMRWKVRNAKQNRNPTIQVSATKANIKVDALTWPAEKKSHLKIQLHNTSILWTSQTNSWKENL